MLIETISGKKTYKKYVELKTIRIMYLSFEEIYINFDYDVNSTIFERKSINFIKEIKHELTVHCSKLTKLINKISTDFLNHPLREDLIINSIIMLYRCAEYIMILRNYVYIDCKILVKTSLDKIVEFKRIIGSSSRYTDSHREKIFAVFKKYTDKLLIN